jgi:hypothetical protein
MKFRMRISFRTFLAILLIALALLLPAGVAAHGGAPGSTQTFTQAIGPYELAITIQIPQGAPAPLLLTIAPLDDIGGATIALRAAPRGQSFANAPAVQVRAANPPQPLYNAQLQVDRVGDWDLEARVEGAKGQGVARIPFTVVNVPLSVATIALLISIGGLIVTMIASIGLEGFAQRRKQPMPGWVNRLIGYLLFACVIVAIIFGVQQFFDSLRAAQAASGGVPANGRPHANVMLRTEPAAPEAGRVLTLTLDLSDGSTGLPVEDLSVHHEALMHLVVISADGAFFAHLHPPRLAPGQFAIALMPDRPGRYTAYIEIERQDSGVQVIARDFQVGGASGAAPAPTPGLGPRGLGDLHVSVNSSLAPLRASRQTTLTFSFSAGAAPVTDLQPWLEMAGHLIARSADGAVYGHIHAAERTAPGGLVASTMRYGPDIRFVYTFPQPGRYQLWAQFRRAGNIVTVPLTLEVEN